MFYDIYYGLCKDKGVSVSRAAEEIGINKSSVTNWKKNGYTPRADVLNKIADYFNVSVGYLLETGQEEKPTTTEDNRPKIDPDEYRRLCEETKNKKSAYIMGYGGDAETFDLSDEEIIFLREYLKAKKIEKEKNRKFEKERNPQND